MFETVNVIGRGRVGSAIAARLEERGVELRDQDAELTLLCVPDAAIRDVAGGLSPGHGWIVHVSGGTPLAALDPHARRFGLHPLQTFTRSRGPEQLDGAFAAVTAESDEARDRGFALARLLGLKPFELADDARPLYHAGAAIASRNSPPSFTQRAACICTAGETSRSTWTSSARVWHGAHSSSSASWRSSPRSTPIGGTRSVKRPGTSSTSPVAPQHVRPCEKQVSSCGPACRSGVRHGGRSLR